MSHRRSHMPHPDDHRRLVIFFISAALIMALSYAFIYKPGMDKMKQQQGVATGQAAKNEAAKAEQAEALRPIGEILAAGARLAVDTPELSGSVPQKGLRFDDLELKSYFTTLENTERVRLLAPANTKGSYFVEIGLLPADAATAAPTQDTTWKTISGDRLTPATPVTLEWDNGKGIVFRRVVAIDPQYVVSVTQSVQNKSDSPVTFHPYARVSQAHHAPQKGETVALEDQPSSVQHIGPIGYLNEELQEETYEDAKEEKTFSYPQTKGWVGITSKYWLVSLLPKSDEVFDARIAYQRGKLQQDIYQADIKQQAMTVAPNASAETQMRFFAGAKKLNVLNDYKTQLDVPKLDMAVDFGVLYILTKPLYHLLTWLGNFFHDTFGLATSFGVALLVMTILVRAVTFPLQNKSYDSMNKMKDLGPKMNALKEQYPDKAEFQKQVYELYKREKINPATGCLPILVQIPIFFALYKVIYITLDMRHAPFWGWVHDLSAPDPSNIFSLFGLLPYNTPEFLVIGAWPVLYGVTMWLQQRLNPQPDDPTQKQIFAMLPWLLMFIFAKLPAGLVIYYTWSNLLGIAQQYSLRKIHGVDPRKPKTS